MEWKEANYHYLTAALGVVRARLGKHREKVLPGEEPAGWSLPDAQMALQEAAQRLSSPPAIDTLCEVFGLSSFERDILLLCVGVELDPAMGELIASLEGSGSLGIPSFGLALAVFPDAYWSAVTPYAALRYWGLISSTPGPVLTKSPIKIDEHALHYIIGAGHRDERLKGMIDPVHVDP